MRSLLKHILDNHDSENVSIKSVLSDIACDSNENFKCMNDKGIEPAIKERKNSVISYKSNRMRNKVS